MTSGRILIFETLFYRRDAEIQRISSKFLLLNLRRGATAVAVVGWLIIFSTAPSHPENAG
jgi:hypothetical protein